MKLFFDTETTGIADFKKQHTDECQPHIVQLAAILVDDDGDEVNQLNVIIRPEGYVIPKEASDVHGISTQKAIECGVLLDSALRVFGDMVDSANLLVGHNVSFDVKVSRTAFFRHGENLPAYAQLEIKEKFCTMHASTNICKIPGNYGRNKWPKLSEAYKHFFGEELAVAHDAMTDLRACKRIFFKINKTK